MHRHAAFFFFYFTKTTKKYVTKIIILSIAGQCPICCVQQPTTNQFYHLKFMLFFSFSHREVETNKPQTMHVLLALFSPNNFKCTISIYQYLLVAYQCNCTLFICGFQYGNARDKFDSWIMKCVHRRRVIKRTHREWEGKSKFRLRMKMNATQILNNDKHSLR